LLAVGQVLVGWGFVLEDIRGGRMRVLVVDNFVAKFYMLCIIRNVELSGGNFNKISTIVL